MKHYYNFLTTKYIVNTCNIKIKFTAQRSYLMLNCKVDAVQKSLYRRFGNTAFFRVPLKSSLTVFSLVP